MAQQPSSPLRRSIFLQTRAFSNFVPNVDVEIWIITLINNRLFYLFPRWYLGFRFPWHLVFLVDLFELWFRSTIS